MKTISFIKVTVAMILMSFATASFAQDSYRAAIKKFQETSSTSVEKVKKKMVPGMATMAVSMYGYSQEEASQLAEKFCEEKLMESVLDWMESSLKPIVSEEDLNNVSAFYATKEGALALEHSEAYNNEEGKQKMVAQMVPDFLKIAQGKKTGKVKSEVPSDYAKLFHDYYELTHLDEIIKTAFGSSLNGTGDAEYEKKVTEYIENNIETVMANLGYPTVTKEDLACLITFFKTDSGKRVSEGVVVMMSKLMEFAQTIVLDFAEYAKK